MALAGLSLALVLAGCSKKQDETAAKLEKMQKQLDETKKQLEEAKKQDESSKTASAGQAGTPVAAKTGGPSTSSLAKDLEASKKAGSAAINENKQAIAANKSAIEANKSAIEANKQEIAANKQGIADNKAAAERAQATADEAKRAAIRPVHTLPAGYQIAVRTAGEISTKTSSTGATWEGTLDRDIEVDGYIVAPRGSTVEGVVANADPGGRVKGVASIAVRLNRILTPEGRAIPIRTNSVSETAKSSAGKDALKTGIASGVGAAIGAIAGGGKGAAIGAGAGAAGGVGVAMATRGDAARIPAETVLTFALAEALTVEERKQR
jgi:hypothetical protein